MLHAPLAYKYVMLAAMLGFVNHYAPRLNLPFDIPLKEQEIQRLHVLPPDKVAPSCCAGIRVKNYSFQFNDSHFKHPYADFTLYFGITKLEDDGKKSFGIPLLNLGESSISLMERASRMKYTVSTNDLHRIATNYLVALEIDPKTFKENPLTVDPSLFLFHSDRGLVPNPLLYAYWGKPALRDPGSNGVAFEISAVSGELLEMNVGNASGCRGLPLINDFEKLAAIPDEEFLKYSDMERSNLVVNFTTCPSLITPEVMRLGLVLTTNGFAGPHSPGILPKQ